VDECTGDDEQRAEDGGYTATELVGHPAREEKGYNAANSSRGAYCTLVTPLLATNSVSEAPSF